jgi:hypothetical protein
MSVKSISRALSRFQSPRYLRAFRRRRRAPARINGAPAYCWLKGRWSSIFRQEDGVRGRRLVFCGEKIGGET